MRKFSDPRGKTEKSLGGLNAGACFSGPGPMTMAGKFRKLRRWNLQDPQLRTDRPENCPCHRICLKIGRPAPLRVKLKRRHGLEPEGNAGGPSSDPQQPRGNSQTRWSPIALVIIPAIGKSVCLPRPQPVSSRIGSRSFAAHGVIRATDAPGTTGIPDSLLTETTPPVMRRLVRSPRPPGP